MEEMKKEPETYCAHTELVDMADFVENPRNLNLPPGEEDCSSRKDYSISGLAKPYCGKPSIGIYC